MGNSQKNKKQNLKDKKTISIQCPICKIKFQQTNPAFFQLHLEQCRQNQIDNQQSNEEIQAPIQLPLYQPTHNQSIEQYIYQKVPINSQKIQFKWQKKPMLNINQSQIMNLTPQKIALRPFQQKAIWFRNHLQKFRIPWQTGCDWLRIQKDNVLMTSIESVNKVNMYKQVKIQFLNEKVNDAGGLLRQWMHLASKQIFSQTTGIFQFAHTNQIMYKIKWDKDLDQQFAQSLFQLFGTILGKAIFQRIPLNTFLDHSLIRQLTSKKLQLRDINGYDNQLYKNWKYLKQNPIQPFGQYFSLYKQHNDGTIEIIQLINDGQIIELTQQNKLLFIQLSIQYYCKKSVIPYIQSLKKSFHKIIPQPLISIFDTYQIQMIIYGLPFINLDDWINNTEYKGAYYKNHQTIKWFWNTVKTFDQQKLARLLHFCTGSTRTPIYGFKKLQSNRGNYAKFLIQSVQFKKSNPFPKGHTCFNRLQLPMYKKQQQLKMYLMAIVQNNMDGIYGLD